MPLSVYSQQLEILACVESYQQKRPGTRCHFTCLCACEMRLQFKKPTWKPHHFHSVGDVRDWLQQHKEHDFAVDIQVEGLRARDKASISWRRLPSTERVDGVRLTWKQRAVIEKLRALATHNPDTPEAQSARRKADELLAKYSARISRDRQAE